MGIFYPLDGLVVIRNRWLILLIKIWVFFLFKNNFFFLKLQGIKICGFHPVSVLVELIVIFYFLPNESCRTYLWLVVPSGGRNWQLIDPNCWKTQITFPSNWYDMDEKIWTVERLSISRILSAWYWNGIF